MLALASLQLPHSPGLHGKGTSITVASKHIVDPKFTRYYQRKTACLKGFLLRTSPFRQKPLLLAVASVEPFCVEGIAIPAKTSNTASRGCWSFQ